MSGRNILVNEELLWNTLHPFGMARFLTTFADFLIEYDDDEGHRFGVGAVVGKLRLVADTLENVGGDLNDLDWQEFKRRMQNQMLSAYEVEK